MQANQHELDASPPVHLKIGVATFDDVKAACRAGMRDFAARPVLSMFFGFVYAVLGMILISAFTTFDAIWIAIAAGVGFPLVAPFLAAGLYEMSRRRERNERFSASDIFLVIFSQQRREFSWMAFVVLFVFWIWAYQIRLLLAIFLQWQSFSTLGELAVILSTTQEGAWFLVVGTIVGAFLATVLFSITVIAMPMLLDKDVSFATAMIASVKTVHKSPVVMLVWGAIIGALTLAAVAPALLGMIVIFPILGHTSWHLYRRLLTEA